MKQSAFEDLYRPTWESFEQTLDRLAGKKSEQDPSLAAFNQLYRKVCHFHALAKERNYSSYLVDHLEDLVVRGHEQLYRRQTNTLYHLIKFTVADFPTLVRREKWLVLLASLLLYGPALLIFGCSMVAPELVYTVVDPMQTQEFEAMYAPDNHVVGSARDSNTNWTMFGFYIKNNISVAFQTFASGLLLGLGTLFFLIYNGAVFGAVAAHLTHVGYQDTFFTFVIGHSSFELTAITIAGAAGLKMGYSLLAPGNRTRLDALRSSAQVAIQLVYGVIGMLVIAAFIEAFWSSNNLFPSAQRYLVGTVLWAVIIAYFTLSGRSRPASRSRASNSVQLSP